MQFLLMGFKITPTPSLYLWPLCCCFCGCFGVFQALLMKGVTQEWEISGKKWGNKGEIPSSSQPRGVCAWHWSCSGAACARAAAPRAGPGPGKAQECRAGWIFLLLLWGIFVFQRPKHGGAAWDQVAGTGEETGEEPPGKLLWSLGG